MLCAMPESIFVLIFMNYKISQVTPEACNFSRLRERLLAISPLGIVVGALGRFAEALRHAINFLTDLLFFDRWSTAYLSLNAAPHHWGEGPV